jgi:hypothetical protein
MPFLYPAMPGKVRTMKKNRSLAVIEKMADILMEEANAEIAELRQDLALEEYKNKILSEMVDERDVIITNLRKDLDGMSCEVKRLRELNNNQAMIIVNNRTQRKDF